MSAETLRKTLLERELALLSPETRASEESLGELLADDFVEFGSSGRTFSKSSIVKLLIDSESTEVFEIQDFRLLVSDEQMALAVYSCLARGPSGELLRTSNRSSLWVSRAGRWQADLYRLARLRLNQRGVTAIFGGDRCTFAEKAVFFSYRRDGQCGRMASLIYRRE